MPPRLFKKCDTYWSSWSPVPSLLMLIVLFGCGSIALVAGALAHVISCRHMAPPPASLSAWEGLATQACIQLLEVCTSHPNQKKVFTAVINKDLLLLLSQAIWPAKQQSNLHYQATHPLGTTLSTASMAPPHGPSVQLTATAQELLRAVVLHSSSIDGVAELGTCFSNSSHEPGSVVTDTAANMSAPRSYHFQLLQVGHIKT